MLDNHIMLRQVQFEINLPECNMLDLLTDFYRPWLAPRVVALLGPQMPVKRIANLTDRKLLDDVDDKAPRKYSLASAIQAHTAQFLAEQQFAVGYGAEIGRKVVKYAERVLREDPDYFGDVVYGSPEYPAGRIMLFWRSDDDATNAIVVAPEEIGNLLIEHGEIFPPDIQVQMQRDHGVRPNTRLQSLLDCDGLIHAVLKGYREIDPEFNDLALANRIRPFPKHLEQSSDVRSRREILSERKTLDDPGRGGGVSLDVREHPERLADHAARSPRWPEGLRCARPRRFRGRDALRWRAGAGRWRGLA